MNKIIMFDDLLVFENANHICVRRYLFAGIEILSNLILKFRE
ncbi:hypothetical protein [Borrelia sp. A-FGy1]|nr:hypothetical protein [Borrelia sp. A-FGy1]